MVKRIVGISLLATFSLWGCKNNNSVKSDNPVIVNLTSKSSIDTSNGNISAFSYDLKKPDAEWKLPNVLIEVSGNTWVDENHLILIEDVHPNLYLIKLDGKNASLEKTIPFAEQNKEKIDIEDVAIADNIVYALWSHGILFKIKDWNSKPDVQKIETGLTKENNTEGLCYDPVTKKLLIACKDASGIEGDKKSAKAVYLFDMASQKLDTKPFLTITPHDFEALAGGKIKFNPSAVAVHPKTHDIYLLSTRDTKCMAVFGRDGQLKSFQMIDKDLMPQPEGICFSPEGVLYISSEGKKGEPGNLFKFNSSAKQ